MKRVLPLLLCAALALSLLGCGGSGSGASSSAAASGAAGAAPQLSVSAASSQTAPQDTDRDNNPIDKFFDETSYASNSTTSVMAYLADQRQSAWKTELYALVRDIKSGLTYDADKKLVDEYVDDAEAQVKRMQELSLFACGDTTAPPEDRFSTAGTIRGTLWGQTGAQVYKDTFFQLLAVSPYANEGGYTYSFDASVETAILNAALSGG